MHLGSLMIVASSLLLVACGTTKVDVRYAPTTGQKTAEARPLVTVARVTDDRQAGPNWLGAIRGGFGNPVKTLTTDLPVRDLVARAFGDALAARGLLASAGSQRYELAVSIQKFDCSQFIRREAHAAFDVTLRDRATGTVVFSKPARIDEVTESSGLDSGVFASTDDLLRVALRAMNRAIDTALDAPELRTLLANA